MLTGWLNAFSFWMLDNIPVLGRIEEYFTPKQLGSEILKERAQ
jgi:hypothetical protein